MSKESQESLAAELSRAEPAVARRLTGGKSDSLTSEQASKIAARIARESDSRDGGKK